MNVSAQLNFVQCKQQRHFRSGRSQFVGNKTKGRISKLVLQENKARQILRKTIISYPLTRTRACAYQELRIFFFPQKIWPALFSYSIRFEIRPFALLPTRCKNGNLKDFRKIHKKLSASESRFNAVAGQLFEK